MSKHALFERVHVNKKSFGDIATPMLCAGIVSNHWLSSIEQQGDHLSEMAKREVCVVIWEQPLPGALDIKALISPLTYVASEHVVPLS